MVLYFIVFYCIVLYCIVFRNDTFIRDHGGVDLVQVDADQLVHHSHAPLPLSRLPHPQVRFQHLCDENC